MQIDNTSAIVTGAASGLGNATAAALAARGARVVGIDLDVANAPTLNNVKYVKADVTSEAEVRHAVVSAVENGPLRVVVNCAGIAPSARIIGRTGVHDLNVYRKVVEVNLIGTFTVLALAAEAIARTDELEHGQRGVVINTVGLTLPAARDLAQHGIRVNTIAPGVVATPMPATVSDEFRTNLAAGVPFPKRLAHPTDFAQLVTQLVEHDYINGETVRMDGALRMAPR